MEHDIGNNLTNGLSSQVAVEENGFMPEHMDPDSSSQSLLEHELPNTPDIGKNDDVPMPLASARARSPGATVDRHVVQQSGDSSPVDQSNESRFAALEEKVTEQANEIATLKSTLADVLQRLHEAEIKQKEAPTKQITPKKPGSFKSGFQPLPSRFTADQAVTPPKSRTRPASPSVYAKKGSPSQDDKSRPSSAIKRSVSNDHINRAGKGSRSRPHSAAHKQQTSYNEDEGTVRMHLKGRPIVLYKPTETAYDIAAASQLPDQQLQLQWVYGYRGKDCRSNLFALPSGEICYFTAAVIVLQNVERGTQRHYVGHNDDVKCMALHPDQTKVASGQVAGLELDGRPRQPQVHVWHVETLDTLHVITGFERGVACVAFSKTDGGIMLGAIDESNDHVLSVWNWQKESKIADTKVSKESVFQLEFHPEDKGSIVTVGKSHIAFWSLESGVFTKKQGLFEKHDKPKYILCVAFSSSGEAVTGDSNGNLVVWTKGPTRKISRIVEGVHEGPVFTIQALGGEEGGFMTGGKDGLVKHYNGQLELVKEKLVAAAEARSGVRTIAASGDALYVGSKRNNIYAGSLDAGFEPAVIGHLEELWGLAVHPTNQHFLTGAHDKQLVLWDAPNHVPLWTKDFDEPIQSADFYPGTGAVIAVAMTTGRWSVIDAATRDLIVTNVDGHEQHDVIRFSPDGGMLAVGSHDNAVYVYAVSDGGRKLTRHGKLTGHSSYITHLDWSQDSKFLQSNSGDYELLFWDMESCKQVTAVQSLRDVEWATQTCTLGFNVLGVWPEGADGTDVNSVARSGDGKLLASGDDFGKVHLFSYPASQPRSVSHAYRGHSSHVTSVQFFADGQGLVSTGGNDCSTMQWSLL